MFSDVGFGNNVKLAFDSFSSIPTMVIMLQTEVSTQFPLFMITA
jgi:hypothetical protein